jgi:hypothetical protein
MGQVQPPLALDVRYRLKIRRAVETGTLHGAGTDLLRRVFDEVVTIELSDQLYVEACRKFASCPSVRVVHGDSGGMLGYYASREQPTFYFLDAHWSGGVTAGEDIDNPILEELAALEGGHADDVIVVDDARVFVDLPPSRNRAKWPELDTLQQMLRELRPGAAVAVIDDQIVAVPHAARDLLREWEQLAASGRRPIAGRIHQLRPLRLAHRLRRRWSAA